MVNQLMIPGYIPVWTDSVMDPVLGRACHPGADLTDFLSRICVLCPNSAGRFFGDDPVLFCGLSRHLQSYDTTSFVAPTVTASSGMGVLFGPVGVALEA